MVVACGGGGGLCGGGGRCCVFFHHLIKLLEIMLIKIFASVAVRISHERIWTINGLIVSIIRGAKKQIVSMIFHCQNILFVILYTKQSVYQI